MPGLAPAPPPASVAVRFISMGIVKLQNLYALNCDPLLVRGLQGPEKVFKLQVFFFDSQ